MERCVIGYNFGWGSVNEVKSYEESLIPKLERHGGVT
jgi:hypothetical protein